MMKRIDQIDGLRPWIMDAHLCPVCNEIATWYAAEDSNFPPCRDCYTKALEIELIQEDISDWKWERFSLALSGLGAMKERLLALIHFSKFQTMKGMADLLIENLGFKSGHPLDEYSREKALEACTYFNDSKKILSIALGMKQFNSWQQKANLAKICYHIDPTAKTVHMFIGQMARDTSPNLRHHIATLLINDTQAWAIQLCEQLRMDKNPLVREAFKKKTSELGMDHMLFETVLNELTNDMLRSNHAHEKEHKKYNSTETRIVLYCDLSDHRNIYTRYLSHIPDLLEKNRYTPKKYTSAELTQLKKNTKESCIRLLAAAINNDVLFNSLLEKLPERVVTLLYLMVWECDTYDTEIAEQKLAQIIETDIVQDPKTGHPIPLPTSVAKDPDYFMFETNRTASYGYAISINFGLSAFICDRMKRPDFSRLAPVAKLPGSVKMTHGGTDIIFKQFPAISSFIAQGHLQWSKNNKYILKSSLKKMIAACDIDEFYTDGDKELKYLKAELLGEFFSGMPPCKPKDLEDPAGFLKTQLNQYFSFEAFKSHRSRRFFSHIKNQIETFSSESDEKSMRQAFKTVLSLLPDTEWVSTLNLAMTAFYDGIDLNPFSGDYEFDALYITHTPKRHGPRLARLPIRALSSLDTLTLPYIKAMMFLMGALGVVEIGYCAPENKILRQRNHPWLTIYDGLLFVRLTDFGKYILGRKETFTHDVAVVQSAEIEVDDHKTMISIYGDDPVRRMALEAVGEQITHSTYMVNYPSFLKKCTTHKDIEDKIQYFRDYIEPNPPAIWEQFFNEVRARINPLKKQSTMLVFKVKPDKTLLSLLTTDETLNACVIRAENYHILVKPSDFAKVKDRLAHFGFFIS